MRWPTPSEPPAVTVITLAVACLGALVGWVVSAPVYILIGPAVAVSLLGLTGRRSAIDLNLRNACFLVLGVTVGTGFDEDALGAMFRWPLAFAFMAVVIWLIMVVCRWMLMRRFGFDRRSALLACAPGHLSFAIAIASEAGLDVARVSVVQSVRLLALTIMVPFAVLGMGIDAVSYTHLRAHETGRNLVCRLLLEKKK